MKTQCPYCDEPVRIEHVCDVNEDAIRAWECPMCRKTFGYRVALVLEIADVFQAPCLNGGEHVFRPFTRYEMSVDGVRPSDDYLWCTVCGHEERALLGEEEKC